VLFRSDLNHRAYSRTAIDGETGSSAFDAETDTGSLFSVSAVDPYGMTWHGKIIFPDNISKTDQLLILGLLKQGIPGLGKTKAVICGTVSSINDNSADNILQTDNPAVRLITKAAINDPVALENGRSMLDDYHSYFQSLGLKLECCFARQEALGGYISVRYPYMKHTYRPWILTRPGSVFVFSNPPETVRDILAKLLKFGLPPQRPGNWQDHPFLNQSGYGEIALHSNNIQTNIAGRA